MKLQQIEQAAFIKLERELHEAQLRVKVSEGAHEQTALNMHKAKLEVSHLEHKAKSQDERVEWMARRMEAHVTELETLQGQLQVSKDAHEQTACQYMQSRQEAKRLHGELSERDHRLYVFVKDLAERTEELAQSKVQLGVSHMARKKADEELTWFKAEVEKAYSDYKKLSRAHKIQGDHAFNNGKHTAELRKQSALRRDKVNELGSKLSESHAERKALQKRLARALEYLLGTA